MLIKSVAYNWKLNLFISFYSNAFITSVNYIILLIFRQVIIARFNCITFPLLWHLFYLLCSFYHQFRMCFHFFRLILISFDKVNTKYVINVELAFQCNTEISNLLHKWVLYGFEVARNTLIIYLLIYFLDQRCFISTC